MIDARRTCPNCRAPRMATKPTAPSLLEQGEAAIIRASRRAVAMKGVATKRAPIRAMTQRLRVELGLGA